MSVPHWLSVRLKNQYPMLRYLTDRTFGVEIEFYGLEYVLIPGDEGIIKPYCISSRAKDGRHFKQLCLDSKIAVGTDRNSWHFEEDTSVRGKRHTRYGAELVSPVLSGLEGLVQAYHAFQFLNEIEGVDIDGSCGFHVHHGVDRGSYRCDNLKQLVRIVHPMESLFYLLIPGERQNARTCRPMEIDVNAFLQACDPVCGPKDCRLRRLWYSPENRYDPKEAKDPRYDRTRYHGLNLHSYWYRSTIEFRYHSAILHHVDEAMQWIIFSQFLVEMSQGAIPSIAFHSNGNKWLQTIYVIYHALGLSDCIQPQPN
ncbi:MAG: amidoligase family protein [Deltaproteobacteria bacterium]|nr:MAG: amidoligase family protein [Deltaproteobacteria bacterium]